MEKMRHKWKKIEIEIYLQNNYKYSTFCISRNRYSYYSYNYKKYELKKGFN